MIKIVKFEKLTYFFKVFCTVGEVYNFFCFENSWEQKAKLLILYHWNQSIQMLFSLNCYQSIKIATLFQLLIKLWKIRKLENSQFTIFKLNLHYYELFLLKLNWVYQRGGKGILVDYPLHRYGSTCNSQACRVGSNYNSKSTILLPFGRRGLHQS